MVDSFAIDAAKGIAQLVGAQAWEEIELAWGFHDHLSKLKTKLMYAQKFLEDVGNAKHSQKSEQVNLWVQQVKEAAYFADNVMDDYAYETLRRKIEVQHSSKKKVRNFLNCATNPVVFRFKMTHKVLEVLSQFKELEKQAQEIGLKQVPLVNQAASSKQNAEGSNLSQLREHADAPAHEFVGREDDKEKLVQLICGTKTGSMEWDLCDCKSLFQMICGANRVERDLSNTTAIQGGIQEATTTTSVEGDLHTIAIQGIGGLGKTTLAKHVFEDEEVDKHFGKKNKIWICVSENFDVTRILKEMLESLTTKQHGLSNTGAIKNKLREALKGEKFLLVLDDVWEKNPDKWDSLRSELQGISDSSKSVILISTRIMEVANKAKAVHTHRLKGLSDNDGWNLLRQKASIHSDEDTEFKDIGKRIVQKFVGVPLAIKAMGPLLHSRKSPGEWENILERELSELPQTEENKILPSLKLSYDHLPSEAVKQCFAYCAIFPKDTELDKHKLITLWMAQGFLCKSERTSRSSTMEEDIGEEYFTNLLNNSFLQEETVGDDILKTKSYKMHDLVHDLATYILEGYMLAKPDPQEKKVSSNIRHFVINFGMEDETPQGRMSNLRTISFWGGVPRWASFICSQYMRVLIVAGIGLKEIPNDIGQLIHLRYLDVSDNYINILPDSICKLYQLQTLVLLGNYNLKEIELPRELFKLENLRHIDRSRDLHIEGSLSVSKGLGLLTNLQTLPPLRLCGGDEGWTIDELENLNQIKGIMKITGVEHVKSKEEARKASLGSKVGISSLYLEWSREESNINNVIMNNNIIDEDVLEILKPYHNIRIFGVTGFMGVKFPNWINTMTKLSTVVIVDCKRCKQLPTFGKLPCLKILGLQGFKKVESIGSEFYHDESSINNTNTASNISRNTNIGIARKEEVVFRALRVIEIDNFESLTTWIAAGTSAFPMLEDVGISECPILETLSTLQLQSLKHDLRVERSGMWSSSLTRLSIRDCPALSCYPDLSQLQRVEDLTVANAGEMMSEVARSLQQLHRLTTLEIGGFRDDKDIMKFVSQIKPSPHLPSLMEVTLKKWPKVRNVPQQLQHLLIPSSSTLQHLRIEEFDELEALPEWIGNLSSLKSLWLFDCKELKYLPSKQAMLRLSRLHSLDIYDCPLLKERCDKHNSGPQSQWPNIQHIPLIRIDGETVQH